MAMHNPPHPGEIIREDCLKPLGLTVGQAAQGLGISRKHLSDILNGHAGISPEMAIRLSKAFGGSPESWLKQQIMFDLWQAEQKAGDIQVETFRTLKGYKGKVKLDVDLDIQRKRGLTSRD